MQGGLFFFIVFAPYIWHNPNYSENLKVSLPRRIYLLCNNYNVPSQLDKLWLNYTCIKTSKLTNDWQDIRFYYPIYKNLNGVPRMPKEDQMYTRQRIFRYHYPFGNCTDKMTALILGSSKTLGALGIGSQFHNVFSTSIFKDSSDPPHPLFHPKWENQVSREIVFKLLCFSILKWPKPHP